LELQHSEQGLTKNTTLISENSGKNWIVKVRVLFDHAVHEQRLFETESADYMLMKFNSLEKRQASIDAIKERESSNIYQYQVQPIDHDEKPKQGEKLNIKHP
jgi:hypothetical protein